MVRKILLALLLVSSFTYSQNLKPILDKQEVINSAILANDIHKAYSVDSLQQMTGYTNIYRSPEMGLTNMWGLYKNSITNQHEIVIRGSVNKSSSWLANYYAAMIPSQGNIQLDNKTKVNYKLSDDERATVHAGWTIASLYLLEDIKPKLDSLYKNNVTEVIISGHSQGAAIAFLLTANLIQMQQQGTFPQDIQFKVYAIAPPKPGNMYFAYQYEKMTKNWSYAIINTQDWVPEVPPTIQTLRDFNQISPVSEVEIKQALKKVSWPKRIFAKAIFNKIKNPPEKSVKRNQKYLGSFVFSMVHKHLPELKEPTYSSNSNYARCSNPIILDGQADQEYQSEFHKPENIMTHHLPPAYLHLIEKQL